MRLVASYFGRFSSPGYGRIGLTLPLGRGFGTTWLVMRGPWNDHDQRQR
jgi:hypothetical protein